MVEKNWIKVEKNSVLCLKSGFFFKKGENPMKFPTASPTPTSHLPNHLPHLSTEWDHWQPKTLTSSTNEFVARFVSDKDTRKTGVAFTWWTENDADTLNSNSSCLNHKNYQFSNETISKLCNVTHLRDNKAYQDEQYGFYSDIYHVFYIIILAYAIVKLMWFLAKVFYKLLTCQYRKVDKQMKEGDSEDEDDDSDFSDSESEYTRMANYVGGKVKKKWKKKLGK